VRIDREDLSRRDTPSVVHNVYLSKYLHYGTSMLNNDVTSSDDD